MCTQGMAWDLPYVLQMSKSRTFQELATKAHDVDVTITNRHGSSLNVVKSKNDRVEFKKNVKFSKSSTKVMMTTSKLSQYGLREDQTRKRKEALSLRTQKEDALL